MDADAPAGRINLRSRSAFDRKRQISIQADMGHGTELGAAMRDVRNTPIMKHLPPGVAMASAGNQEAMAQLFGGYMKLPLVQKVMFPLVIAASVSITPTRSRGTTSSCAAIAITRFRR